ncbi:MAG: ATP-binding cassette domain-containing protein [Longimicrobiales bacterium]
MNPLFVADCYGKSFGSREVLKAASAWAIPGAVTALFGRNGSGKSTLLRAALGIIRADFGLVKYDGNAYLKPRLHHLARRGLMYLPDRGLLSRRHTLQWHHRLLRLQMDRDPMAGAVEAVGAGHLLQQEESQMSGGEKRRAELSLVLARNPRCLIADEPLAGIAPSDKELVSAAIRTLADKEGCAILVTGHDVDALMDLSDDVVWMVGGTTHWLGSPASAREHYQFRQEYLGPRGYER